MFKKFIIAASAAMILLAAAVFTQSVAAADGEVDESSSLSYSNLTFAQVVTGIESDDYSGYSLTLNYAISDNIFILLGRTELESKNDIKLLGGDLDKQDADSTLVGMGFHKAIIEGLDFVSTVGFQATERAIDGEIDDADGFAVSAGVRYKATRGFELSAEFVHNIIEEETLSEFKLGIRFFPKQASYLSFGLFLGTSL